LAQERADPFVGSVEALAQVGRGLALMGQSLALPIQGLLQQGQLSL
jgi:hypothetical protein